MGKDTENKCVGNGIVAHSQGWTTVPPTGHNGV